MRTATRSGRRRTNRFASQRVAAVAAAHVSQSARTSIVSGEGPYEDGVESAPLVRSSTSRSISRMNSSSMLGPPMRRYGSPFL
jgi:hypothetical protein